MKRYRQKVLHLLLVVEDDGASLLHYLKHHDAAQLSPHRHGHVGECRQLVHELQQLLCASTSRRWKVKIRHTTHVHTHP